MGKGIYLVWQEMKLEDFVPVVVKGNEQAENLLTALTTTHIQAQTFLQDYFSQSVTVSLMKLNYRVQGWSCRQQGGWHPSSGFFQCFQKTNLSDLQSAFLRTCTCVHSFQAPEMRGNVSQVHRCVRRLNTFSCQIEKTLCSHFSLQRRDSWVVCQGNFRLLF